MASDDDGHVDRERQSFYDLPPGPFLVATDELFCRGPASMEEADGLWNRFNCAALPYDRLINLMFSGKCLSLGATGDNIQVAFATACASLRSGILVLINMGHK